MAPVDVLSMAARFVVAGTLLVAAWAKLRDRAAFAHGVHDYGLLSPTAEKIVVRLLPAAEIVIGIAVLFGVAQPWPSIAAVGLFSLFGAAIAITAHSGRDIPCHCFGASSQHRVGAGALLRTLVLVLLALVAAFGPTEGAPSLVAPALRTTEVVMALVGMTAAMTLAVVLAEPLVLLLEGIGAARRRAPALKATEAARRGRTCRASVEIESGVRL